MAAVAKRCCGSANAKAPFCTTMYGWGCSGRGVLGRAAADSWPQTSAQMLRGVSPQAAERWCRRRPAPGPSCPHPRQPLPNPPPLPHTQHGPCAQHPSFAQCASRAGP
jgi:hypothetical protein